MSDEKLERPVAPKRTASPEVPVVVVQATAQTCLVQWFEGGVDRRCILPVDAVDSPALPLDRLRKGVPYGLPFAQMLKPEVTPEMLEIALHGAGIWTFDDLQSHPDWALSALQAAYGVDLGHLLEAAQAYSDKKEA